LSARRTLDGKARTRMADDGIAKITDIYVVRTSLPAETCDDATTVRSYKSLALAWRLQQLRQPAQ
jgi:hypothetical protein